MAGISTSPLLPFRKHEPPKPLHSRWGDVSITVPTDGSWSQYHNPQRQQQRHARRADYEPEYSSTRARAHPRLHLPSDNEGEEEDESISTYTSSSSSADSMSSRRSSIMSTLKPRRLSMRLTSSRPKSSAGTHDDRDHLITDRPSRPEFAYKPIKMDYPAEVAETKATTISTSNNNNNINTNNNVHRTNSHSSRFKYIPAPSRYREEFAEIPSPLRSQSVSSRRSRTRTGSSVSCVDDRRSRSRRFDDDDDSEVQMMSMTGPRVGGSVERAKRASPSSAKFLTTAMVPDPDEIYE